MGCDDKPDGEVVAWAAQLTNAQMWSPDYGDFWATIQERDPIQDFTFETSTLIYNLSPIGMVHKLAFSGHGMVYQRRSYDSRVGAPIQLLLYLRERCWWVRCNGDRCSILFCYGW